MIKTFSQDRYRPSEPKKPNGSFGIFLLLIVLVVLIITQYATAEDRGKLLRSLNKYDNNKAYRSFVHSRNKSFIYNRNRVGYQPYITFLPGGASLRASAVVSGDRRYVRIGVNPYFSRVGKVRTFTFRR